MSNEFRQFRLEIQGEIVRASFTFGVDSLNQKCSVHQPERTLICGDEGFAGTRETLGYGCDFINRFQENSPAKIEVYTGNLVGLAFQQYGRGAGNAYMENLAASFYGAFAALCS